MPDQHPENERFVPRLKANRTVRAPKSPLSEGLGCKATITWLYYKDLGFSVAAKIRDTKGQP